MRRFDLMGMVAGCMLFAAAGWSQDIQVASLANVDIPSGNAVSVLTNTEWPLATVGSSNFHFFNIYNTDLSTTLSISSFNFSDNTDFQNITNDSVNTIPPGESRVLGVSFNPASEGVKPCTMTINSNDPDSESAFVVNFQGTAFTTLPSQPMFAFDFGKDPKPKLNKKTGSLDLKLSLTVLNSGSETATTPTINVWVSNSKILTGSPAPTQTVTLKALAAGKNGKAKKGKAKLTLSLPNADAFVFVQAAAAGQPDSDPEESIGSFAIHAVQ